MCCGAISLLFVSCGSGHELYGSFASETSALLAEEEEKDSSHLSSGSSARIFSSSLVGTIRMDQIALVERLIWRTSRGNAVARFFPIEELLIDEITSQAVNKAVFNILYVGEELEKRLKRVLKAVGATEYDLPATVNGCVRLARELGQSAAENEKIVSRTEAELHSQLSSRL